MLGVTTWQRVCDELEIPWPPDGASVRIDDALPAAL
jgi:hypothetical protein